MLYKYRLLKWFTPVLASLHWLPVCFRIDFKILFITFKAINGLAPDYIFDIWTPYEPSCGLRSSGRGLLSIPGSRLRTKGDRAFGARVPRFWNDLPEEMRLFFYRKAYPDFIWAASHFIIVVCHFIIISLLILSFLVLQNVFAVLYVILVLVLSVRMLYK